MRALLQGPYYELNIKCIYVLGHFLQFVRLREMHFGSITQATSLHFKHLISQAFTQSLLIYTLMEHSDCL